MPHGIARLKKRLAKKAKKGFRGYPMATIALYGPDDHRASKLVASIIEGEEAEPSCMRKWFSEDDDVRNRLDVAEELHALFAEYGVLSITMVDRIIGCPHEEGIDYEGPVCPRCPFWANRDRWTGEIVN